MRRGSLTRPSALLPLREEGRIRNVMSRACARIDVCESRVKAAVLIVGAGVSCSIRAKEGAVDGRVTPRALIRQPPDGQSQGAGPKNALARSPRGGDFEEFPNILRLYSLSKARSTFATVLSDPSSTVRFAK